MAAARQLRAFGINAVVLEGRDRIGGRVHSMKIEVRLRRYRSRPMPPWSTCGQQATHAGVTHTGTADLGGSIITGVDGNPLAVMAKQLHIPMYRIDAEETPLFFSNGKQPSKAVDRTVR